MTGTRSGSGPDDPADSWTTETLPLSVRKDLLERELSRLGFRKSGLASRAPHEGGSAQQQQQPQGSGSSHPQAETDGESIE